MRHLNSRLLIAAVVSIGLTTVAAAADLPARTWTKAPEYVATPPCAWCGWYIGANGGGAWSGKTGDLSDFTLGLNTLVAAGLTPSNLGADHSGGFGGGQFGYNWVMSNVLIGFEADIQGANIGGTSTINQSFFNPNNNTTTSTVTTASDHIDWFGTARARLGFTTGSVLFYGTGGLAFGGVNSSVTNAFSETSFTGNSSETRFGWASGAGLEWMFAPNWSLKAEYLHVDLGSSNVRITSPADGPTQFADYRFRHEFELGARWRELPFRRTDRREILSRKCGARRGQNHRFWPRRPSPA